MHILGQRPISSKQETRRRGPGSAFKAPHRSCCLSRTIPLRAPGRSGEKGPQDTPQRPWKRWSQGSAVLCKKSPLCLHRGGRRRLRRRREQFSSGEHLSPFGRCSYLPLGLVSPPAAPDSHRRPSRAAHGLRAPCRLSLSWPQRHLLRQRSMCMRNAEMEPLAEHPGGRARGRGTAQGKERRPVAWLRIVGAAARRGGAGA